ncbi:uncharacterized protein OCT59_012467 [Rhizophagus irregularis]|uniref:uncharacterized protein n=1 Tax=Rhizophagus irregularis TaxID=588596 RepID=UPI003318B3EC|nr:hypothetical protein OCT59_012467 [Rhizophagus irregularis]
MFVNLKSLNTSNDLTYDLASKIILHNKVQIKEAEEINNNSSNSSITSANSFLSYNTHSEAIYTSRLLNYNNLPEPKNSDDYYEQNDNIISREFSGQNSESGSKRKNYFLSQINESESERKKIRIE